MKQPSHIRDLGLHDYVYESVALPHQSDAPWQLICQLPHNAQYQPWLELSAPAGEMITVDSTNPLAKWMQEAQSYTTTEGRQSYEAPGWISGQGVIYQIPAGVTVHAVKYRETGYDTDFAGHFKCNDADYNILWEKATRTCYLCMRDHFMDCPDRERTPLCLGDVCIQMEEIFYTFDTRSHQLAKEAILNNPDYTHIIDQNLMFAGEYGTWFYYMNTGDLDTIKKQYPNLRRHLKKWQLADNGVIEHNTEGWDWCDWGSPSKDKKAVQCCMYYSTLKACRKMAELTGHEDDLPEIDQILSSIEENFDAVFWQGSHYMSDMVEYPDERANALAVITGLASEDKWDDIYEHVLSKKLNPEWEEGHSYSASSYFERWVMEALCKMGHEEFALLRMADRYRSQIESDTTSLWEHFDRWWQTKYDPNSTLNHGWNSPNTILSRYIAGVEPVTAGWDSWQILPKEAFLKEIDLSIDTVKGQLRVDLHKTTDCWQLEIHAPESSRGIVGVPLKAFEHLHRINVNDERLWCADKGGQESETVSYIGVEDGYHKFSIPSGDWEFKAEGKVRLSDVKQPRAARKIAGFLDPKNWIATAFHTNQGPHLIYEFGEKEGGSPMDGLKRDLWRGWSSGVPQEAGQWYMIDMQEPQTFNMIRMDYSWAFYDYPRTFKILTSNDGESWEPVSSAEGQGGMTEVEFPTQTARYLKMELTEACKYWWSIFRLDLALQDD